MVQAFLKKGGIDLNKRDTSGNTPLFYVCMKGARDIAKLLIENGADINKRLLDGGTALHYATGQGNQFMVKVLLDAGSEIDAQNEKGTSPLIAAAISCLRTSFVKNHKTCA